MMKFFLALSFISLIAQEEKLNIAVCIMATGKYLPYAERYVQSARKYFCTHHAVTYFVFTDGIVKNPQENIITIYQKRLGWPHDTLMRFAIYNKIKDLLKTYDYIFACDADMLFVDTIDNEILHNLVATLHPGFLNKRGSYEQNPLSQAYVDSEEGECYFAGGFYGGDSKNFLRLLSVCEKKIEEDLHNNYIAEWHDESHLNRYFIDHEPTCVLTPSYCYPESWKLPFTPKLMALDKNHSELRE